MATKQTLSGHLRVYYDSLKTSFATKQATEHSYRSALENLIQELGGKRVRALNEPRRDQIHRVRLNMLKLFCAVSKIQRPLLHGLFHV